jgi:hypothetical protein
LTGWNIGEITESINIAALPTGDGKKWYEQLWVDQSRAVLKRQRRGVGCSHLAIYSTPAMRLTLLA